MSRPALSPVLLSGGEIKLRLEAERLSSGSVVHLDWVRFTVLRRNFPLTPSPTLFTKARNKPEMRDPDAIRREAVRFEEFKRLLSETPNNDVDVFSQSFELAEAVAEVMGKTFSVASTPKKGIDFYKFRWSIELNGVECGWVGFLSSSDSPRQQSQALTMHVNLFGTACTFAAPGWNLRLADVVDSFDADLTRADLALDFFDGLPGGIDSIREDYRNGLCNVGGRKLKFNMVGDWENGHDRSLYIGSREAGKITNVYEKGDQLFGEKSNSEWLRAELRYGNKLRVLSSDLLRRPADFFAGASDWHAALLLKVTQIISPEPVRCVPRLQVETVLAECTRNVRWMLQTAAASVSVAFKYLTENQFLELVENQNKPGRLRKFSESQISLSLSHAFSRLQSVSSVDSSPAFAKPFIRGLKEKIMKMNSQVLCTGIKESSGVFEGKPFSSTTFHLNVEVAENSAGRSLGTVSRPFKFGDAEEFSKWVHLKNLWPLVGVPCDVQFDVVSGSDNSTKLVLLAIKPVPSAVSASKAA